MGILGNKYPPILERVIGLYYCENKDTYFDIALFSLVEMIGSSLNLEINECNKSCTQYRINDEDDRYSENIEEKKYWLDKDSISYNHEPYFQRKLHNNDIDNYYKGRQDDIIQGDYKWLFKKAVRDYSSFNPKYDFVYCCGHMFIIDDSEKRDTTARQMYFIKLLHEERNIEEVKVGEYVKHGYRRKVKRLLKLISEKNINTKSLESLKGKDFQDFLWLKKFG